MKIVVKKLTPDKVDDFLYFFDFLGFEDNPHWAGCYCCFFHFGDDAVFDCRTAQDNRNSAKELILAGKMNGLLAYAGDKPVAWCHADARENLDRLKSRCNDEKPGEVGAVVCFVVAPEYRHQGIATKLLNAACADFESRGFKAVEAYPAILGKTDAENYHGPLDMYLGQGFEIVGENGSAYTLRKKLRL